MTKAKLKNNFLFYKIQNYKKKDKKTCVCFCRYCTFGVFVTIDVNEWVTAKKSVELNE